MPSAKELAKALAQQGEIRNTPQNSFLGAIANFLAPVSEFADRDKLPGSIPLLGGMSFADLSGLKGAQSLVNDMSYGTPPIRGASLQTAKVDPRVLDLAGVSGAMIPVGKALGKAALKKAAEQIETGTDIGRAALNPRMSAVPEGASMPQRPKTEFEILHDTAQRNAALPVEQGGLGLPANNTYIDRANVMYPTDAYHGGNSLIKEADYKYSGKGSDQYGSAALYTGSDPSIANSYVKQGESGNIMPLRINREGHVEHDKAGNLTASQIKNLIKASPDEDALSNFGDVGYEGANKVLGNAVNSYKDVGDGSLLTQMNMINNDFYTGQPQKFNEKISELTGITGLNVDVGGGNQFYLSYKPENVRSRFAAFDPMRRHEADILAGVGVGGMLDPQAIAEALRQQDRK